MLCELPHGKQFERYVDTICRRSAPLLKTQFDRPVSRATLCGRCEEINGCPNMVCKVSGSKVGFLSQLLTIRRCP